MAIRFALRTSVLFTSVALLYGCAKSPESTVESFFHAVARGEITEAKTYLSAQVVGLLGERKLTLALSSQSERVAACGGMKSIAVKLQGEGELRSGTTTVAYNGKCSTETEKTKLIKEDGKWKITAGK